MRTSSKTKKNYKVLSLFAGCGGLDLGFHGDFKFLNKHYKKTKFEIVFASDIDQNSCLTYNQNFKHKSLCADIRKLLSDDYKFPQADIVLGGFPCQDFSLAGKRRGFSSERGNLYRSMVEVVKRVKPVLFLAENVKGLLSAHNGEAIKIIEKDFGKLGYSISTKLYLAADFGVPQSRERVIIIGTLKSKGLPKFDHPEKIVNEKKWVRLHRAIGDLEKLAEGEFPNHYWSKAKMFPGTQGNTFISSDKVGPTMRSEHHGNIEWHWNKSRRLSAREAARIQSFPDNFIFYPSTSSAYKQVGNAVPPVLGWHLAKNIELFLDKNIKDALH